MNNYDNMPLHRLYNELDCLLEERRHLKQYRTVPEGQTLEEVLQELDEEEIVIRARIEELSIVAEDYNEEF